jgi:hypothetical protein
MSDQERGLSRREVLRLAAAGVGGVCASGFMDRLATHAAQQAAHGTQHKSCILLWMDGGPSHMDTFDMKPDASDAFRGEYQPIQSSVPGLQITAALPRIAPLMRHAAVIRGMSTGEAEHGRARVYMHTGYRPGSGGLRYPSMGSIVSASRGPAESGMPNFVVTGMHLNPANHSYVSSPGYLGPRHQPLIISELDRGVENLHSVLSATEHGDRLSVLDELSQGFLRTNPSEPAQAQRTVYQRAVELMRSERARAFDLSQEPVPTRAAYGDSVFGRGCLLARRLVEVGVPFVEVYHSPTIGGWDTHTPQRAAEVKNLALPQLDRGMSALINDLHQRGLLESTLVIWMGEFGRTPRVKPGGGRDHYARAWSTVLFGGGIRGGQIIGRTDSQGTVVQDRPVSAIDFMATICQILGVDPNRNYQAGPRPVRIVDRGANPIRELLS